MGKKFFKLLLLCGMFFSYSNLSMASSSVTSEDILDDMEKLISSKSSRSLTSKNATTAQRSKAVAYGVKQIGKPYAIKTTLTDTSKWYCSKLTYKMWKDAGYDVSSKYVKGIVTPNNIRNDANLRVVKVWNKSLPGMI